MDLMVLTEKQPTTRVILLVVIRPKKSANSLKPYTKLCLCCCLCLSRTSEAFMGLIYSRDMVKKNLRFV